MHWNLLYTSPLGIVQKAHTQGTVLPSTLSHAQAYEIQISLIEDLFQIQTNAFRFVNHDLYLRTPLLAAIAAFCWLVPIATVYPPSALIVGLQTVALDTSFNVTILHQKSLLDLGKKPSIALIWCRYYAEPGDQGHQAYVAKPPSFPEAAQNASLLSKCKYQDGLVDRVLPEAQCLTDTLRHISEAVQYLISSSLISGELPRLNPPSGQNSSYSLEFWGTVLNCVTNEREVERLLFESDIAIGRVDNAWTASALVSSDLTTSNDPNLIFRNTTITHRKFRSQGGGTYQYYPCLNESIQNSAITNNPSPESISLPRSGKRIFTQSVETTCHPKLVKYSVIISHGGEGQNVLYSINEEESVPEYTSRFDDFKGTFEQFAHFSDAVALYTTFAANLNMSRPHFVDVQFAYPNYSQTAKPYTTTNGTVVQTCTLTSQSTGGIGPGQKSYELWPLSVFERRLRPADGSWLDSSNYQGPSFDSKMATELLINTTISALSLNERFDLVNGTESRSFNIYRFEHKLTFFLPYGLAFGLAIPIIALGLVALYVQNHGVSAMSGGFLQLLMTTTGRTEMEAAIQKGSGTLGGYENVSKELREVEVRFGELFDGDEDEGKELSTADLLAQECGQSAENIEREQTGVRSTIDNEGACRVRRAGFGTARDVRPLGGRVRT
jgi:hypothetical protein